MRRALVLVSLAGCIRGNPADSDAWPPAIDAPPPAVDTFVCPVNSFTLAGPPEMFQGAGHLSQRGDQLELFLDGTTLKLSHATRASTNVSYGNSDLLPGPINAGGDAYNAVVTADATHLLFLSTRPDASDTTATAGMAKVFEATWDGSISAGVAIAPGLESVAPVIALDLSFDGLTAYVVTSTLEVHAYRRSAFDQPFQPLVPFVVATNATTVSVSSNQLEMFGQREGINMEAGDSFIDRWTRPDLGSPFTNVGHALTGYVGADLSFDGQILFAQTRLGAFGNFYTLRRGCL